MSKKKILLILSVSILFFLTFNFKKRQLQKESVNWVESKGGMVQFGHKKWVRKLPKFISLVFNEKVVAVTLSNSNVKDITPLKNFDSLMLLELSYTKVEDISILENLSSLESLKLSDSKVKDIAPLLNLNNLTSLSIINLNISEEQIDLLKKANPKLSIIYD